MSTSGSASVLDLYMKPWSETPEFLSTNYMVIEFVGISNGFGDILAWMVCLSFNIKEWKHDEF